MMAPLVSIIVPVYNRENIKKTLDSIISQTYKNIEVVIVNDGSAESVSAELEALIAEYKDDRIHYLLQTNKGPSAARNNGLRHCNGEYVCFFDSDDIMLSQRIEKQIQLMEIEHADVCCGGVHYENKNIDLVPPKVSSNKALHCLLLHQEGIYVGTQAWVYKKELLIKVGGYNEKLWSYEDIDLTFRCLIQNNVNVSIVTEVLTVYCDSVDDKRLTNLKNKDNLHFIYGFTTFYTEVIDYILKIHSKYKNLYLKVNYKILQKLIARSHKQICYYGLMEKAEYIWRVVKRYNPRLYYMNRVFYILYRIYFLFKDFR